MTSGRIFAMVCLLLPVLAAGCGGGGGGGGSSSSTALRIIHGSVDGSPVSASIGETLVQKAHYGEETNYVGVTPGDTLITLERQNAPGQVVATFAQLLQTATHYTILVYGEARHGTLRTTLLEEPVLKPAAGSSRLQLINALSGKPAATLRGDSYNIGPVALGTSSGFIDIPSGVQTVTVGTQDGRVVGRVDIEAPDRGDVTVVASGSADLNVSFVKIYYGS